MTYTTPTQITNAHPALADDCTYLIITDDPFPTTDADALRLMTNAARILATRLLSDIDLIAANDFSDDDTDYMPANSNLLNALICATATSDESPLNALNRLIHDYDFINDLLTCDTPDLPISIDL